MFRGSPLFVLYLRALGARIGRGVVIFPQIVPTCSDLLTIGDGAVIRKDAAFSGYRTHAGVISVGPITLGRDVIVGEGTVIEIDTTMGDGAQLGHGSSLQRGQSVPAGESWHGSPAQQCDVDYRSVAPARCSTLRRTLYGTVQLLNVLILGPIVLTAVLLLARQIPQLARLVGSGPLAATTGGFYVEVLVLSAALFFGSLLLGLVFVVTVPKLLRCLLVPDRVYRLYGIHYWLHRTVVRVDERQVLH